MIKQPRLYLEKTMQLKTQRRSLFLGLIIGLLSVQQAMAAIELDRTRVIFPGGEKSVSLTIRNENTQMPYLAQAWMEDESGKKITSPMVIVPPLQRIEPGASSQLEVRSLPAAALLPQDRESVFYFNLREIPPKSNKPNTLQLALQTRIKFFYRPAAILQTRSEMATPWQDKLTLNRQGDRYIVTNPTPYYASVVSASNTASGEKINGFHPIMVAPKTSATLGGSAAALGSAPVLTYINDYGGSKLLIFRCAGTQCRVAQDKNA